MPRLLVVSGYLDRFQYELVSAGQVHVAAATGGTDRERVKGAVLVTTGPAADLGRGHDQVDGRALRDGALGHQVEGLVHGRLDHAEQRPRANLRTRDRPPGRAPFHRLEDRLGEAHLVHG
jgi:hypothetical protein